MSSIQCSNKFAYLNGVPETYELVFWQSIVSMHQAYLISALAEIPGIKVTYVAQEIVSKSRSDLGWQAPSLGAASLILAKSVQEVENLILTFPQQAVHLCQGIRGNGLIGTAIKLLMNRKARIIIMAETIDDHGLTGVIKRILYSWSLRRAISFVDSILAIGMNTSKWFIDRGFPKTRVIPFTYFLNLPPQTSTYLSTEPEKSSYKIAFIGNLILRKRLDLLIRSLGKLDDDLSYQLIVVGTGPLEDECKSLAFEVLGNRVKWYGSIPSTDVSQFLSEVDCLVLPSSHDGWGAVVTEALIVGTNVICSDACGAAEAVRSSGAGSVFPSGDQDALAQCLLRQINNGKVTSSERKRLADWARSFGGQCGAEYLIKILNHRFKGGDRPSPPWENKI